jgi:CheY-like chemotaxis protein
MVPAALTWYGQATDRRKTLEAGFDVHLVKPVELERVTEVLALARDSRDHRLGQAQGDR